MTTIQIILIVVVAVILAMAIIGFVGFKKFLRTESDNAKDYIELFVKMMELKAENKSLLKFVGGKRKKVKT